MSILRTNKIQDTTGDDALTFDSSGNTTVNQTLTTTSANITTGGTNNLTISDGNLVIGTSGHGIDFSATSDGTTMSSELLDDYEEGTFTMTCDNSVTLSQGTVRYTRIGNLVNVSGMVIVDSDNSNATFLPNNLPFNNVGGGYSDLSTPAIQTENWDLHADFKGFGGYAEAAKIYIRQTRDNAGVVSLPADSGANMLINLTYRTT